MRVHIKFDELPIHPIRGVLKNYPWGSRTVLAEHRGVIESEFPEAELWFGDHPRGPALLLDSFLTLDQITEVTGTLPFLAKILAVDHSLSLQVHPSLEDVPKFKGLLADENHKPEMVVALTQFQALVGFQKTENVLALVAEISSDKLSELIAIPMEKGRTFTDILANILGVIDSEGILEEVARKLEGLNSLRSYWLKELISLYAPSLDPLATILCELVSLNPGQSLYLPPRCIHAYLQGVVVEVMANSDNVIRGGLTTKPIDRSNFLALTENSSEMAERLSAYEDESESGFRSWRPPIEDFSLCEFYGNISREFEVEHYAIIFAWQGSARVSSNSLESKVYQEVGALLAPGKYLLQGEGSIWVASGKGR